MIYIILTEMYLSEYIYNYLSVEPGERDVIILRHNINIQWPDNKTVIYTEFFLFFRLVMYKVTFNNMNFNFRKQGILIL